MQSAGISRRETLRRIGAAMLTMAATGCGRTFVARALYPEADALSGPEVDRVLQAFALTVVPGAEDPAAIARAFADPTLKLAPYRRVLVAELNRHAQGQRAASFDRLDETQRTALVQAGLASGGISGRVLNGAVFLAQVVYYGGLWNSASACPRIGFDGPYVDAGPASLSYPDAASYLPASLTTDGNPA
jgi:hypothetical protein